ncbi:MAG: nucleotide exchange factor GrpE [Candidatus Scalindua sp.]|jgi:molecular chaperone GrpE|nr:nucleotide exchange factor GrpE [Candidatus Scalindua sp.]MBT5306681.1 nucleotide exchange factor GrpE [Candidatus Scalindua sp.]MBT6048797.1 nucleotide exchange factor GrpE [Candidatus Scalindua sp.]MBT6229240.1 nucleotide exchange factor GrpE [Candidatus Scalindua sp.]MBT6562832.1 nucleotide exchange factor GrpE [Candidatus Scalindua sp.]
MSKGQENHDEENAKAEQSDMNSDKDRENIESPQGNSEQETDTDENSKMEDDIEAVQGEAEEDIDEPADLTKEEILELKKKAEERDTYLDQLLRTKAEFMNYQKRVAKEHESTAQFAVQNLILDFLPELDNFERALKLADDSNDFSKFVEGIKLIEEQLFKVLGKYGVESIETAGKAFDPNLHEAVMEEENNEMPHHTIVDEFQRGFLLKERVIRPSKVKVSKRTIEEEEKEEDKSDE